MTRFSFSTPRGFAPARRAKPHFSDWGRGLLTGLCVIVASALVSCGAVQKVPSPIKQKTDVASQFIVGAFPGPPNGFVNAERYEEMAQANVDVIVPFWGTMDGELNPDMLDLAHAAGLRVLAMDTRIGPITMSPDSTYDPAVVEAIVNDYKDHPALFGYGVRDEPSTAMFPRVTKICRLIEKLDPDHAPLVDLFPGYATPKQLGADTFRQYVRQCIAEVDPPVLMYNHYPLRVNRAADSGWHRDLALFREECREAGIPFWLFAQCQGIRGYLRVPNRAEIFWQGSTALAYGARGVWWYRYWTQPPDEDQIQSATSEEDLVSQPGSMIDRHGKRAPSYNHVRDVNGFLREAGPALIGWDNRFVARFKNSRLAGQGESPAATPIPIPRGGEFDLVVGTFVRGEAFRLVLANDSYERPAAFRLSVAGNLEVRKVAASLDAKIPANLTAGEWTLGPGGCAVVELTR